MISNSWSHRPPTNDNNVIHQCAGEKPRSKHWSTGVMSSGSGRKCPETSCILKNEALPSRKLLPPVMNDSNKSGDDYFFKFWRVLLSGSEIFNNILIWEKVRGLINCSHVQFLSELSCPLNVRTCEGGRSCVWSIPDPLKANGKHTEIERISQSERNSSVAEIIVA